MSLDQLKLPVLDVHKDNINCIWPAIKHAISTATFIGLDLELSGLGNRKNLLIKCVEDRYSSICETAKSRSIISLGITCFKSGEEQSGYLVQTYNILTLCSNEYVVEPQSLQFLTEHGFDFNRQYAVGLPYTRGKVKGSDECYSRPSVRLLFLLLTESKVPLVVHNGLLDLIFLYQSFYTDLPSKLHEFLADLEELFPSKVFDTKYIAEYHVRTKASYLQYIFWSCLRQIEQTKNYVTVAFCIQPNSSDVFYCPLSAKTSDGPDIAAPLCKQYANHGWCAKGACCTQSHDAQRIINAEHSQRKQSKKSRRHQIKAETKKRKMSESRGNSAPLQNNESVEIKYSEDDLAPAVNIEGVITPTGMATESRKPRPLPSTSCHRAGVDAFMTALCFAVFKKDLASRQIEENEIANKLFLSGKDIPLRIARGNFGKPSKLHCEMMKLFKTDS